MQRASAGAGGDVRAAAMAAPQRAVAELATKRYVQRGGGGRSFGREPVHWLGVQAFDGGEVDRQVLGAMRIVAAQTDAVG